MFATRGLKAIPNRIDIANLHGGGILMTTLIFVFGEATPRVLKWLASILAHIAGHHSGDGSRFKEFYEKGSQEENSP